MNWSEADDAIEANLEHWEIRKLAERYDDESSMAAVEAALRGPGDIDERIEVLTTVLKRSLTAASSQ